jgi:chemotaxis protein CheD
MNAKEKTIRDVYTGEVYAGGRDTILRSNAIASCVVIVAYDKEKMLGALAHVMVPGVAPAGKTIQRTRYAANAIEELLNRMAELGASCDEIEVCIAGGGNVLKREDDSICQENIDSVTSILNERGIPITAEDVGGTLRRTVSLDVETGRVYVAVGDGIETLFWSAKTDQGMKEEEQ